MPLPVSCSCGKRFKVKDDLAGKKIKCPYCAAVVRVPPPGPVAEEVPVLEAVDPEPVARPARKPAAVKAVRRGDPFWTDPNNVDSLVALTDSSVLIATLSGEDLQKASKALEQGEPARKVLKNASGKVVPLECVRKVESDLNGCSIDLYWRGPGDVEDTETNILCGSQQARDEVMRALHDRLGRDEWAARTVRCGRLRAALMPLWCALLFGFFTFCMYMVALGYDKGGGGGRVEVVGLKEMIFKAIFSIFGPTVTAAVGGACVTACLVWLFFRVKRPPVMCTLKPGPPRRPKYHKRPAPDNN